MIALTVVSIGVAVATVTDLQFSLFGACVALAWIIPSAFNKILWSNVQRQENWTALAYVSCSSELFGSFRLRGMQRVDVACEKEKERITTFTFGCFVGIQINNYLLVHLVDRKQRKVNLKSFLELRG